MKTKKYALTSRTINHEGHMLYQIIALHSFSIISGSPYVKVGDLGGWIGSEKNLSHEGGCWVADKAKVYGKAKVRDDAWVCNDAEACDDAEIYGSARIYDHAKIHGKAKIWGNTRIFDGAEVYGEAEVYGDAEVFGFAEIFEDAKVYDYAKVCSMIYGSAEVYGEAEIFDNCNVFGYVKIHGVITLVNTELKGNAHICGGPISIEETTMRAKILNKVKKLRAKIREINLSIDPGRSFGDKIQLDERIVELEKEISALKSNIKEGDNILADFEEVTELGKAIHEGAKDLRKAKVIDDATMGEFDKLCGETK